jgi:IS4 transposase
MVFKDVLARFVEESPTSVMARAALENMFAPEKLDAVFERTAERQYTRDLMFSTVVDVMGTVVCRIHPSMHQAYLSRQNELAVSAKALYDKLNRMELGISRELVRYTAQQGGLLIRQMKGARTPLLKGYRCKILDGNHIRGTDHRLEVLRGTRAGALPGHALVLLDPELMLIIDIFPCADGHAQERSILPGVLPSIIPKDLLIADRNFCTTQFLFGIHRKKAFFLIRQHARNLHWRTVGKCRFIGRTKTGRVYEQVAILTDPETGEQLSTRRITVKLKKPTRDGDTEIHLFTNVPAEDADALVIANLYLRRWTLETAFQEVTTHLKCELKTLGYPQAALFAFCVAIACYNLLAVIKGALCAVHGETKLKDDVSNYQVTAEISGVYRGMMIAIPAAEWEPFQTMTVPKLSQTLLQLARRIRLEKFQKFPRGPKKPPAKKKSAKFQHVSTAKLLAAARQKPKKPT